MKCPKCQKENAETRKFCRDCGAKLLYVCPKCGSENLPDDKFCGGCGKDLRDYKVVSPLDYSEPQSYTPKYLADKILTARRTIEGERKIVSVLFADVANYTSLSEKLDAEEVQKIMDGCLRILIDEIYKYEGTIDKFTGDGLMALFGAPVAHEDHVQRSCYAALAMQRSIEAYGEKIKNQFDMEFKMRMGLHTGPVIVGSIGNDLRMDYTAIGDTINLASRMQTTARPSTILVTSEIYRNAREFFKFSPLGKVKVKGKEIELDAYQLLEAGEIKTRFEAAVVRGLTRFVGRQKELSALKDAFEMTRSGFGQVVGITGEAGVGKSRVALEFIRALPEEEFAYSKTRCSHYGSPTAYLPILDILKSYFVVSEGEREYAVKKKVANKISQLDERLRHILAPLHDLLSLEVEDEEYLKLEPVQKRERIFEAVRDLILRESQNKPLVIAIDDLQWIDKTSEDLLNYLIGWLGNTRVLLILIYRLGHSHPWGTKSYYTRIHVDNLSAKSSTELLQSILHDAEIIPELNELIISRAEGNPLFIEEFTRTLMETGYVQKRGHQYVLSAKTSAIQVPDTIQGIIAARIDRLGENLKLTMQLASVIGRDFTYRILNNVTGAQKELKSYLINLQELEFIHEKSLFPELEYVFKHTITQEVSYNSLLLKKRKEIHEKVGVAIEEIYSDKLEEFYEKLAYHHSQSDNWEKAYQYYRLSGDKLSERYFNWEAFRCYREAIKSLKMLPATDENRRRLIENSLLIEGPMIVLGYPQDSLEILLEAEKLSMEQGDKRSLAVFQGRIRLCHTFKGDPKQGLRYAEQCFITAESIKDVNLAASTAFDLAAAYTIAGDHFKIVELAPKALALLESGGGETIGTGARVNVNVCSSISAFYGYSMANLGHFEEGKALCEKGLRYALEIDNFYNIALGEIMYGSLFIVKGDGKNAIDHLQIAIKYGEECQIVPLLGLSWMRLGQGYYFLGDLEKTVHHIKEAIKIQNEAGIPMALSGHYYWIGMVALDSGDANNALSNVEEALKLSQINKEKHLEGSAMILLGRILGKLQSPKGSKAEANILQGIEILEELKLRPFYSQGYLYLGELHADMGHKERALETLEKANQMFQEMGMDYWLHRTQSLLKRTQESTKGQG